VTSTTVAADVTSQSASLPGEEVKVTTESQVEKQTSRAGKQQESIAAISAESIDIFTKIVSYYDTNESYRTLVSQ